jgi:uncharacterized membrane protein
MFDTKEVDGASGEIGISSPVVGDIDRDGSLEVLIGDTGGKLYCINAGGGCVPGQVDWPMFHGDLNKTGVYSPGTSYGVKVDRGLMNMGGMVGPEDLSKSVRPGQTVSYNVTVQNIGASKTFTDVDTFWLDMNQIVYKFGDPVEEHEWPTPVLMGEKKAGKNELLWGTPDKEFFDWGTPEEGVLKPYVVLRSMQKVNLTINVTAPWSGDLSELCQVELKAQSGNDTFARDSVVTKTSLEITLDFEIDILKEAVKDKEDDLFGQKVIKINPSDKATVEVMVKNEGSLNDSYNLRIEGHQYFPDWDAYFVGGPEHTDIWNDALQLDAAIMEKQFPTKYKSSDGVVKFTIVAPADAQQNELLTLKVLATSRYSEESAYLDNLTKVDYLIIEVNPVPDLELKCRDPREFIEPGGNKSYKVEVINRGNSEIDVELEHGQLEPGWSIWFTLDDGLPLVGESKKVSVIKEGVTNVYVTLGAPENATAGSRQDVVIKGTTVGDTALVSSDSVALTAIVTQKFNIEVKVSPEEMVSVNPGTVVTYNITVENKGNGKDFIIITPTKLEVNWESTFYLDGEERVTSELDRNTSVVFNMRITIPKRQLAKIYDIGINVSSIGDRELKEFFLEVKKVFNLTMYGIEHSELTSDKILNNTIQPMPGVSPGLTMNYVFELTNGGNDKDLVNIKMEPMIPSGSRQALLSPADWTDFDELGWEVYFIGITNTEAYLTDVEDKDFTKVIDMSPIKKPIGYLNDANTTIRNLQLKIGVDQTIWLKVQIRVPRDLPDIEPNVHPYSEEPWYFRVKCESADPDGKNRDVDLSDNKVMVNLNMLKPDLMISHLEDLPSNIQDGESISIVALVSNRGDIEAKNVIVTFYVDGEEVKSRDVRLLGKDVSKPISFNWQASSGDHKLEIVVDPENVIVEKKEDNNEKSTSVSVESEGFLEILSNREACSVIAIIIVVVILAVILIIIKKRGSFFGLKPGGGGEEL